ncbi:energy transducer TonB [Mucilaginibacter gotjawali]|uniref:TonB family protein n=2 Tax=Mucilaginibacter gotjawali TaxID=1550579 RepID=A0A839SCS0_9SPHI|nr:energy transducer TonB [Mucilaginibacter gotjawali]MBB3054700.1 TonB family protein [Mucilaginibacter gotjawali]
MKTCILTILLLISGKLFAQKTMEVKTGILQFRYYEDYSVLQADPSVREGGYTKYFASGDKIMCTGFYKNNLKDGLWVEYRYNGMVEDSGYYKQDRKTGIWAAYKSSGMLQIMYDYTKKDLLYLKRDSDYKTKIYTVIDSAGKKQTTLDRPPVYLDGESAFNRIIAVNVVYPAQARNNYIQGTVFIGVTINKEGAVSGYRLIKPLGYDCDESALKAVKSLPGEWLPGILDGKSVTVEYEIAVSFRFGN